jgi:translation initiation factor IF-3
VIFYLLLKNRKGVPINARQRFLRANEQINITPVILIGEDGVNVGTVSTKEALNIAYEKGLDLVEINPNNRPPICKIMDFGRYKYDLAKKEKEARARHKETTLKEIRLTYKIGDHDIDYKAKQAREFFDDGDQVKVSMRLRGRENALVEIAFQVFDKFALKTGLAYEKKPFKAGNTIVAMLTEKKEPKNESK